MALTSAVMISPTPPSGLTVTVGSTVPTPDPEDPELAEAAFPFVVSS